MPVQTRSQTKFQNVTIRPKKAAPISKEEYAELLWVKKRITKLALIHADTYGREDQIRLFIEMYEIVNEYSDVIIKCEKLVTTIKRKSYEYLEKLTRDTQEDKILRETLKTTLKLLN